MDSSVLAALRAIASSDPGRLAVVDSSGALTYGDLWERASSVAYRVTTSPESGAQDGRVGVVSSGGVTAVVGQVACWIAGRDAVMIDPTHPPKRRDVILDDAAPTALLIDSENPAVGSIASLPTFDLRETATESVPAIFSSRRSGLAYVLYTSGSTGQPKGVKVSHNSLAALVDWHVRRYQVTSKDRASSVAAVTFDAFQWEVWPYLAVGAEVHFADPMTKLSPGELSDWLATENISMAFLPTPLAHAYIHYGSRHGQLRHLLTGGDALALEGGHPLRSLVNHYGLTETTVVATAGTVAADASGPITIGHAITPAATLVVAEDGSDAGDQPGELLIGGHCVAEGYTREDDEAGRFIGVPGRPGRWFRTGDIVTQTHRGLLFHGRTDRQVQVRGVRIELGEVEASIRRQDDIADVVVVHDRDRNQLVAFVVPVRTPLHPMDLSAALQTKLAAALPAAMVVRDVRVIDRIPLTLHDKADLLSLETQLREDHP